MKAVLATLSFVMACGTTPETTIETPSTFHLPGQVDEINLSLRDDATFAWRIFGCDFSAIEEGRWQEDGTAIQLLPKTGETSFNWIDDVTFQHPVGSLRMSSAADGTVSIAGADLAQTWQPQRICAVCGTGPDLGPKSLEICADQTGL